MCTQVLRAGAFGAGLVYGSVKLGYLKASLVKLALCVQLVVIGCQVCQPSKVISQGCQGFLQVRSAASSAVSSASEAASSVSAKASEAASSAAEAASHAGKEHH